MSRYLKTEFLRNIFYLSAVFILSACVTTEDPELQQKAIMTPAIIAVATPGADIPKGSSFAWLSKAVNLYKDERLDTTTIQYLIELNIKKNLTDMGFSFVDSESKADYAIAYTAALESSLDDTAILRRFGLVPGNMRIPEDNPMYEKGTLVIYTFDSAGDVIWRSAMQVAVDFTMETSEREERIKRFVHDMFNSLPTRATRKTG